MLIKVLTILFFSFNYCYLHVIFFLRCREEIKKKNLS